MKTLSQEAILRDVFNCVYGITFDASNMDHRVMLQKAVFLMREVGVSFGNYDFVWDHYGPFSAFLSDDMKREPENAEDCLKHTFSNRTYRLLDCLAKEMKRCDVNYTTRNWAEALASLCYIKKYIHTNYTNEEIIEDLEQRKEYLRCREDNEKAMQVLENLMTAME